MLHKLLSAINGAGGVAVRMKALISGGLAPPIECFHKLLCAINGADGVAVRMKALISGGLAPPIECFISYYAP